VGAARVLYQIKQAIAYLNPQEVREMANRPVTIELYASGPEGYREMEEFFAPAETLSASRRAQVNQLVRRAGEAAEPGLLRVYEAGLPHDPGGFTFDRSNPKQVVCDILEQRPELGLSLARQIHPFRYPVTNDIIKQVSKENALFSVATAVPSIVPFLSLPWAIGEFASDTAFLTGNQIRMAFMLAAASDRTVGYRQQRAEIASLFAGAFGWRALARELSGKIPLGGGLLPKAAISFAATYVVGMSLERYYRLGYSYTKEERKRVYEDAFERGKAVVQSIVQAAKARTGKAS
jgi:hypothetical protein